MDLLPWQRWLLIHALELLPDGTFRFRTVVVLVARQNGKSTLAQILALFFMYVRAAALVIGTAQNLDIAEEVWQGAVDIAEDVPELAEEIDRVVKVNGKKSLELVSGERYKVQAANRRGGRGLSGDLVVMDELREHQNWDSWSAVTKTTLARIFAQIWALSNAGDAASVVLRHLRRMAHESLGDPDGIIAAEDLSRAADDDVPDEIEDIEDDSLGLFEWSAPPGCGLDDVDGIAQANPALGHTITERAIGSARRTDPEWVYRTEVMCQWSEGTLDGPFPGGAWEATLDPDSKRASGVQVTAGVDVSVDRSMTHISFAAFRADGMPHIEVVASRGGTEWVEDWLRLRVDNGTVSTITGQGKGAPVSPLLDELEAAGLPVRRWEGSDMTTGTGQFYDLVCRHNLRHLAQPVLDVAAAVAVTKPSGESWLWNRRQSPADIASLVSANAAVWALLNQPKRTVSAYEHGDLVIA